MNDLDAIFRDALRARLLRRMGAAVQHDLKSPVQGLSWCLDLIGRGASEMDPADPRRQQIDKALTMARNELSRMERNSRALLADAGILDDEEARFDLAELARELTRHFTTEAAMREVALVLDIPDYPVYVRGWRGEIGQALLVRIVIALDTVASGGRLEVGLRVDGNRAVIEVLGGTPEEAAGRTLAGLGLGMANRVESTGGEFSSRCVRLPLDVQPA
jgi:signal transduction histidine kinase